MDPGGWWIIDEPELHQGGCPTMNDLLRKRYFGQLLRSISLKRMTIRLYRSKYLTQNITPSLRSSLSGSHLSTDILVPDLAGWRRERIPELPDTAWFELAPDWVCEILSPSTAQIDRGVKMPIYAREGVRHLWLVDPDIRTLEVYTLGDDGLWSLLSTITNDDPVRLPPFDAISFPLDGLWAS